MKGLEERGRRWERRRPLDFVSALFSEKASESLLRVCRTVAVDGRRGCQAAGGIRADETDVG